jgi:hypothetical protein
MKNSRLIAGLIKGWDAVMDSRHNPLRSLPMEAQHYFMQVLGWMWSMVFSLSFLSIFQFHLVWGAHFLILAGIVFTVAVFRQAEAVALQPVESLSDSSACVWKLDNEA